MRDIWEIELLLGWTLVSLVRPKAIPNTDKINPTNGRHGQAISILWNLPTCAKLGTSQLQEQLLGHSLFHIVLLRKMENNSEKQRQKDTHTHAPTHYNPIWVRIFACLDGLIENTWWMFLRVAKYLPTADQDRSQLWGYGWNSLIEKTLGGLFLLGWEILIISNYGDMMKGDVWAGVMEKHLTTVSFQERELST